MQDTNQLLETLAEELHSLDAAIYSHDLKETLTALSLVAEDARKLCIHLKLVQSEATLTDIEVILGKAATP